jgi:hypothetical protein
MSDFANLTDSFQQMGFEEKQADYHDLQIEYPILDLLPVEETVTPLLKPPAFSGYREKPHRSEYHLPLSGTDFIIRLSLQSKMLLTPLNEVFTTLLTLLAAPGRSLLQIVTHSDPEDGDHYRFRLLTKVNGHFKTVAESELSGMEWEAERTSLRREKWMRLITHLLIRLSNRAYFHVHERLKQYRWYTRQVAGEKRNYKNSFDPKRFFAANLRVVIGLDLAGQRYWDEAVDEYDLEGEGVATFLLPCSHKQDWVIEELRCSSVAECLHIACGCCGARLARKDNGWRLWLLLHRQTEQRAVFSVRELVWQRIGKEFPVGTQQISVNSDVLHNALQHAARSIQPPESTSPIVLHPAHSDNFAKVVNELYSQLRGAYKVTCTSTELFNGLLDKLDKAVGIVEHSGHESDNLSSLPRAWEALAFLWLTRATQLAGIPGYDGRKPLTVFENQASDDEDLTPDDDEIDELEEMMKGARLE